MFSSFILPIRYLVFNFAYRGECLLLFITNNFCIVHIYHMKINSIWRFRSVSALALTKPDCKRLVLKGVCLNNLLSISHYFIFFSYFSSPLVIQHKIHALFIHIKCQNSIALRKTKMKKKYIIEMVNLCPLENYIFLSIFFF